ncbi:MAG: hypothetical protein ACI4XJ_08925 [Eubacteriales bacterium]
MKINLINDGVIRPVDALITARIRDSLDSEFTLSFTLTEMDTPYIHDNTLVQYGEQYFHVISYQKDREGKSPTCAVECEHVSYSLNDDEYKLEEFVYSGSAAGALTAVLSGTPMNAGTVEPTGTVNISLTGGTRKAILISVAAIIGGEIEYSGYTVNLRKHRGSVDYIELLETDNVTDVSYSRDVLSGTTAYNIQLGRKTILSCGDNVHIKFTPLEIDVLTRITAIEYNPYNTNEVEIEVGDYVPDILDNLQKTQNKADTALKTATDTVNSLSDYAKKSEVSASIDTYVNSEAGRASIVLSLKGTYVEESDLSAYTKKTELSAEIGAYIDTQAGTAKIINNLTGTFAKTDALGNYVEKTKLSTEIGSYIDTAAGTAKIISAASGTYQKKSDMGDYVTTTTLNTSIAQYIDSFTGTAKIVSACSGTYAKQSDLSGYAKVSAVTSVEQSVSNVEAKISLTASYGSGTIGSNVRALLTLVTNADSSSIKLKADAIELDGTVYMKTSDYVASGTTMIRGAKIQTSDLYIEQLRTSAGKIILDYSGSTVSVGGGNSSSGSFATMSNIDLFASSAIRIGYGSVQCGFYYESAHFSLRAATSSDIFYVGTSTYPVDYIYCDNLYVGGTKITGGSSSSTAKYTSLQVGGTSYYWKIDENAIIPSSTASSYFNIGSASYQVNKLYAKEIYINGTLLSASGSSPKFTSLQVGGTSYYWKIDENAIIPNSTSVSYFKIGSSTYPVTTLYAKEIYLDGTKLTAGGSSSGGSFAGSNVTMGGTTTYYITCNTSRELRPSSASTSYPCYLGTSSYYWHYAYIGANTAMIGSSASSKLGFFGTTAVARQTVSSTATVATLITALKNYGLIA